MSFVEPVEIFTTYSPLSHLVGCEEQFPGGPSVKLRGSFNLAAFGIGGLDKLSCLEEVKKTIAVLIKFIKTFQYCLLEIVLAEGLGLSPILKILSPPVLALSGIFLIRCAGSHVLKSVL